MHKMPSDVVSKHAIERLHGIIPERCTFYLVQVDRNDRVEEVKVFFTPSGGGAVNCTEDVARAGVGPLGRSGGVLVHDTPAKYVAARIEQRLRLKLGKDDIAVKWL